MIEQLLNGVITRIALQTRPLLAEGIPSRQLQETLETILEPAVGSLEREATHYLDEEFALILHDGRGVSRARPGGFLVFTDIPEEDPRLGSRPRIYPDRLDDRPSLDEVVTDSEFRDIARSAEDGTGWVFAKEVSAVPGTFFFSDPEFGFEIEAAADLAAEAAMDDLIGSVIEGGLRQRRQKTVRF